MRWDDIMTPELRKNLKMNRIYALNIFRDLRSGCMDKQETAEEFMYVYESMCVCESWEWKTGQCGYDVYGDAHPCCVFQSRLLLSAIILLEEDWIKYDYLYLWNEIEELVQKYNLSEGN